MKIKDNAARMAGIIVASSLLLFSQPIKSEFFSDAREALGAWFDDADSQDSPDASGSSLSYAGDSDDRDPENTSADERHGGVVYGSGYARYTEDFSDGYEGQGHSYEEEFYYGMSAPPR